MGVSSSNRPQIQKMGTLQKFKLLATQCGVAQSPTRSPRTSPLIQFRRRKPTLLMLLTRSSSRRSDPPVPMPLPENIPPQRNSLKDLFVSSPPFELNDRGKAESERDKRAELGSLLVGKEIGGVGPGSPRPAWTGFRYKSLLRRAWRPVLVTIPE
ncbi:uncharacterized protein LOC103947105 [Pyrus x bretschneideri]|uniref:uncharacterized protein LOC103947105 n=1 Tax=Pyrus x bretschneideri TaxID=225117 RepID=UPI00202E3376|nr:uncharacterized protein LOC103947105 [Pyrus x bretschneideri]